MLRLLTLFLLLCIVWVILSGHINFFFAIVGIITCVSAILILKLAYQKNIDSHAFKPFSFIIYVLWLIKEIIKSSFDVALRMWKLDPEISPKAEWVKHNLKGDNAVTLFANSITLTPGTVTIDAKKGSLFVHALTESGMKDLQKGAILKFISKLIKKTGK